VSCAPADRRIGSPTRLRVASISVNRKERRSQRSTDLTVDEDLGHTGCVRASISYGVTPGAAATIKVHNLQFVRAEKSFAADCAIARVRLGSPELHFAQLDLRDEKLMVRAVLVRFERHRFIERAKQLSPFIDELEEKLGEVGGRGEKGASTRLFEAAKFEGEATTVLFDAEMELTTWLGGRAGMVFLGAGQNELASVVSTKAEDFWLTPQVEVTMTSAVLADLLNSWKNTAGLLT
jgi:hypothetical protein